MLLSNSSLSLNSFRLFINSASSFIIKRDCSSCDNEHKQIFYKRLTILPSTVSPYDLFLTTWASTSNELNEDFELYSSLEEVHQEHNKLILLLSR